MLGELQVSDRVVENEHLENWLEGCVLSVQTVDARPVQLSRGQELLCGGSFGLLEINGGPSLNFLSAQQSAFQTCALGGDSCPSALQEALLECSGVI